MDTADLSALQARMQGDLTALLTIAQRAATARRQLIATARWLLVSGDLDSMDVDTLASMIDMAVRDLR